VIRNINENREDQISRSLFAKNLKVPQRYQVFKTDHYNCYPMEKLDYTLTTLLESNPSKGVGVSTVCAILKSVVCCIPSLEFSDFRYPFLKFSTRSVVSFMWIFQSVISPSETRVNKPLQKLI